MNQLNNDDIIKLEERFTSGVYLKRNLALVRGKDCLVYDANGKEYIDCLAGHGSVGIGRCNPAITNALIEQSQVMVDCSELFYNDVRAKLLEKLASIAPGKLSRAYLCNSGTESVEAALKFARMFTGKKKIISTMMAFHGRTFGSLSATWKPNYRKPFEPLVPEFEHIPYNNIEAMEKAVNKETAAVILEPIQGESGVIIPHKDYLKTVKEICVKNDALLIIDEVQTGLGRTGKWFASEHFNVEADIMTCAKILGCGYPIGATIIREDFVPEKATHGSTFGGNPLACAVSLAILKHIEEKNLLSNAEIVGKYFVDLLKEIENQKIREARGLGLMIALELKVKNDGLLNNLMQNGVLAMPTGKTIVRFLPPLTFTKEYAKMVAEKVRSGLNG